MKKTDEVVEKVLAGLRGVEAGAGFEERMVRRVRGASREREGRGWFGGWHWVGVGCLLMLLVGGAVSVVRERRDAVATDAGLGGDGRGQAGPGRVGTVGEGVSQRLKPGDGMGGSGPAAAVPLSKAGLSGREGTLRAMRARDGVHGMGFVDSAKVVQGGFPAPPLPLTAEERLLLRVARRGEPLPVVALEVAAVPSGEAEETAEFFGFFGRPERMEQGNKMVNQGESR